MRQIFAGAGFLGLHAAAVKTQGMVPVAVIPRERGTALDALPPKAAELPTAGMDRGEGPAAVGTATHPSWLAPIPGRFVIAPLVVVPVATAVRTFVFDPPGNALKWRD